MRCAARSASTKLIAVCECDALSRPGARTPTGPASWRARRYEVVRRVDAGAIATRVMARAAKHGAPAGSDAIAQGDPRAARHCGAEAAWNERRRIARLRAV